jgi:hypothetical protein
MPASRWGSTSRNADAAPRAPATTRMPSRQSFASQVMPIPTAIAIRTRR